MKEDGNIYIGYIDISAVLLNSSFIFIGQSNHESMLNKILLSLHMVISLYCQISQSALSAESKKIVAKSEEANVALYATEREGMLENFEMKVDGGTRYFPFWINISKPSFAPRILFNDINHDGKKELIVVLTK